MKIFDENYTLEETIDKFVAFAEGQNAGDEIGEARFWLSRAKGLILCVIQAVYELRNYVSSNSFLKTDKIDDNLILSFLDYDRLIELYFEVAATQLKIYQAKKEPTTQAEALLRNYLLGVGFRLVEFKPDMRSESVGRKLFYNDSEVAKAIIKNELNKFVEK